MDGGGKACVCGCVGACPSDMKKESKDHRRIFGDTPHPAPPNPWCPKGLCFAHARSNDRGLSFASFCFLWVFSLALFFVLLWVCLGKARVFTATLLLAEDGCVASAVVIIMIISRCCDGCPPAPPPPPPHPVSAADHVCKGPVPQGVLSRHPFGHGAPRHIVCCCAPSIAAAAPLPLSLAPFFPPPLAFFLRHLTFWHSTGHEGKTRKHTTHTHTHTLSLCINAVRAHHVTGSSRGAATDCTLHCVPAAAPAPCSSSSSSSSPGRHACC